MAAKIVEKDWSSVVRSGCVMAAIYWTGGEDAERAFIEHLRTPDTDL